MTNYELASIILQLLTSIAAFGVLLVYHRQLRVMSGQLSAMQESSRAQSGLSLVDFLQAQEVRKARHIVRDVLAKKPHELWSEEERNQAALVTANYDVAGALIKSGLAPVELVAANWGPSIKHCYEVLEPFIQEHRKCPGADPKYWSNFKWLYDKAKEIG
jgi:hypothetical protein